MHDKPPQYLTVREVANRLQVSCSLLHKLKRLGTGPIFRRFGRSVRYTVADVDEWDRHNTWKSVRRRRYAAQTDSATHPSNS